jgi:hypothetical protein
MFKANLVNIIDFHVEKKNPRLDAFTSFGYLYRLSNNNEDYDLEEREFCYFRTWYNKPCQKGMIARGKRRGKKKDGRM